jgi:UDP-N-acetylglucosamine 2-epimerase (non-hydrolysing)
MPIDPLSYPEMVLLVERARAVVTDSGGLQKEAYVLGVPCTTLRTETEWVETLSEGWNVLMPAVDGLDEVVLRRLPEAERSPHYGDGRAAARVVAALQRP